MDEAVYTVDEVVTGMVEGRIRLLDHVMCSAAVEKARSAGTETAAAEEAGSRRSGKKNGHQVRKIFCTIFRIQF
jgi:hypothetical protein